MELFNPHIKSRLVETPAPAAGDDAPRTQVVLVVGTAGRGPTEPVAFERARDAYAVYGTQGTLARDIELAIMGATYGTQVAGTSAVPRVYGLRLKTGTPASATLYSDLGKTERVMRLETVEHSDRQWAITFTDRTVLIDNPITGGQDRFFIDRTGAGYPSAFSSVLAFADELRRKYEGQLVIEVYTRRAFWEISISDEQAQGTDPIITSTSTQTSIRLDRLATSDMAALALATAWIADAEGNRTTYDFSAPDALAVHNKAIPESLNADARFYAITAGSPVEVPKGTQHIRIEHLADAKLVGGGTVKTLLNLRTTGVGAASKVALADAGKAGSLVVSEGYWRVRGGFAGTFDPGSRTFDFVDAATHVVDLALPAGTAVSGTFTQIDGVTLRAGMKVLKHDDPLENGIYTVVASGSDFTLQLDVTPASGETIDVLLGTEAGSRFQAGASNAITKLDAAADGVEAYVIEFDAPEGIADEGGPLSRAYAAGMPAPYTAAMVSTDRLGTHFTWKHPLVGETHYLRLDFQRAVPGASPEAIPLTLSGASGAVKARITWKDGKARILLDRASFDALYGDGRFDDASVLVHYDSCIFLLEERASTDLLSASGWQYATSGDRVTFNKELPHALVVRGLRVVQYRLGEHLTVVRRAGGNELVISGEGIQPGEGGGPIGKMEVIFGADYVYEPDWPVEGKTTLTGGSAGVNVAPDRLVEAIDEALAAYSDLDYRILVPSGIYADSVVTGYDPVTGVPVKKNAGLLDVLQRHQERRGRNGAPGIVYVSVTPMKAQAQSGRYTDQQKRQRFLELTQPDAYDPLRLASVLASKSYPTFFIFDAPMAVSTSAGTLVQDGTAFLAGLRSALPNDVALYQVQLPQSVQPLYRYDASDVHMPSLLAEARVNVWSDRRGDNRLADERTAAGKVLDSRGQLVPSSFQSGPALLAASDFLQAAVAQLRGLLGPLPSSGVDTLRSSVVTILNGVAAATRGVRRLQLNPDRDIRIYAAGGNALGMSIRLFVQVAGELRVIDIQVGASVDLGAAQQTTGIPVAR